MATARTRTRSIAVIAGSALVLAGFAVGAGPVQATLTSSVTGDVLTLTGNGDDDLIDVGCVADVLNINGADPDTGPASCSALATISADGQAGNDMLALDNVTAVDGFTGLTSVTLEGGLGDDTMFGSGFADLMNGGDGRDTITGAGGPDSLSGGGGTDTLVDGCGAIAGAAQIAMTNTQLSMSCGGGPTVLDLLTGFESADLRGFEGADTIDASGFGGKARLSGWDGVDTLTGGPGRDLLDGQGDDDVLFGDAGNDALIGGTGNDTMVGGPGSDTVRQQGASTTLTDVAMTSPTMGDDSLSEIELADLTSDPGGTIDAAGFSGDARLGGTSGDGETVIGGSGNDSIDGYTGSDTLSGGSGDDSIVGRAGVDDLAGGAGDDYLNGGPGADSCAGGPGRDTLKSC